MSWSITENAISIGRSGTNSRRRLLSRMTTESAFFLSASSPSSALSSRALSTRNGEETIAMTIAPSLLAISAIVGEAPVPVPPPIPAVMKTRFAPFNKSAISFLDSSAHCFAISGYPPAPNPLVSAFPMSNFLSALTKSKSCLSVLIATVSVPFIPILFSLFTVFPPPPPIPKTSILGFPNSSKSAWRLSSLPYSSALSIIDRISSPPFSFFSFFFPYIFWLVVVFYFSISSSSDKASSSCIFFIFSTF